LGRDQAIETQVVDALNKAFGAHPGYRPNHAKGIVVEGSFKASFSAPKLSRAALFNGSAIPVTVRFSNSTGIPNLPDGSALAKPHGMAIKFHLPDVRPARVKRKNLSECDPTIEDNGMLSDALWKAPSKLFTPPKSFR
jgi:hypothetical protein